MNDRYRFRVWDEVSKRYFFLELKFGDNGYHPLFIEKPIFEQCTGLKDKNGKLIYEGDIVRCARHSDYEDEGSIIAKIVWSYPDASFYLDKGNTSAFDLSNHSIEIIGNIHENPDLLENKDD